MGKVFNECDEIEIRLRSAGNVYENRFVLEWRFREPKWKFLFLTGRDRWRTISYFREDYYNPEENVKVFGEDPNDDFFWGVRGFDFNKRPDVDDYTSIKSGIHTKKELFEHYKVKENLDAFYGRIAEHVMWKKINKRNGEEVH